MNALIFVQRLLADYEPLLRDERNRAPIKSPRLRTISGKRRSEPPADEATPAPPSTQIRVSRGGNGVG